MNRMDIDDDDGVLGQVVSPQLRVAGQPVGHGQGADIGVALHLHNGGLQVGKAASVLQGRGSILADVVQELLWIDGEPLKRGTSGWW